MNGIETIRAVFRTACGSAAGTSGSTGAGEAEGTAAGPASAKPGTPSIPTRPLLMTHAVAGYPDLATSERFMKAILASGGDILEAQLPFSDPSADGPAIVAANRQALDSGTTTIAALELIARVKTDTGKPVIIMSYLNPLLSFGIDRLVAFMVQAGLDGLIVPDCPDDEPEYDLPGTAGRAGLAFIPLLAPSTTLQRAQVLVKAVNAPFAYTILRLGVTGRRSDLDARVLDRIRYLREGTGTRIAAGFGIREAGQVAALAGIADCVIAGSAILAAYNESVSRGECGISAVGDLVRSLKGT